MSLVKMLLWLSPSHSSEVHGHWSVRGLSWLPNSLSQQALPKSGGFALGSV